MKPGSQPRVAIVGPRRVRTGLGPFLAKHLAAQGAAVPAFIASREETIEDGRAALRRVGIDARGYTDLGALLAADPVDALVIATPHATHLEWIERALDADLHVLCEKPFVWTEARRPFASRSADAAAVETPDARDHAARLLAKAAACGRLVMENCPWPYALPAFDALHPGVRAGMRTLEFEMSPSSSSPRDMLVDTMSHPLSVLQACLPDAEAHVVLRRWHTVAEGDVHLAFTYSARSWARPVAVSVRLRTVPSQPRPMALTIDGHRADRHVRMPDYAMSFSDGEREVPLPDPMSLLVAEFVRTLRDGEPAETAERRSDAIANRLVMLCEIVGSFPGT